MKKVYVIHGIHDGVLAVCSNIKRAYEVMTDYNSNSNYGWQYEIKSYSQVTKMFKQGYYEVRNGDCRVEMFYLNNY